MVLPFIVVFSSFSLFVLITSLGDWGDKVNPRNVQNDCSERALFQPITKEV